MASNSGGEPGKAKQVAARVCASTGHNLESFKLNPLFNPKGNNFIEQYEVRCTKCTLTPKQIDLLRDRDGGKAKSAAGGGE